MELVDHPQCRLEVAGSLLMCFAGWRGLTINSLALKSTCFRMFGHPLPINRNHLQFAHADIYIYTVSKNHYPYMRMWIAILGYAE